MGIAVIQDSDIDQIKDDMFALEEELACRKRDFADIADQFKQEQDAGNKDLQFLKLSLSDMLVDLKDNHGVIMPLISGEHKLSINNQKGGTVVIENKNALPTEYWHEVTTVTRTVNKPAILKDIQDGKKVPGAKLSIDRQVLRITHKKG